VGLFGVRGCTLIETAVEAWYGGVVQKWLPLSAKIFSNDMKPSLR
jgi:hypothetical protein